MSQYHTPVLLEESVDLLAVDPAGTYVDLTFGGGGHSRRILEKLGPGGRLYAFDQDRDTRANCPDDGRFHYVESNFRFLRGALRLRAVEQVDAVVPPVQAEPPEGQEKVYRCAFTVYATKPQLRRLKEFLNQEGIRHD